MAFFSKDPVHWHEDLELVLRVANCAVDRDMFKDEAEVVYFFEKPHKFNELYEAMLNDRDW